MYACREVVYVAHDATHSAGINHWMMVGCSVTSNCSDAGDNRLQTSDAGDRKPRVRAGILGGKAMQVEAIWALKKRKKCQGDAVCFC